MINFKIPDNSCYLKFANSELEWLPMDTEELYQSNLKTKKNILNENGWLDKKISYKFNSLGFRSDYDFDNSDNIMFFGCSHTLGIGIPYAETWPFLVATNLNKKCYNLGIGGGSNDTAFRLAYNYIPRFRPKIVILLITYNSRLELLRDNNKVLNIVSPESISFNNEFYKEYILNDANLNLNTIKNIYGIENICNRYGCKFIAIENEKIPRLDLARDLIHHGTKSNLEFSKIVLNDFVN